LNNGIFVRFMNKTICNLESILNKDMIIFDIFNNVQKLIIFKQKVEMLKYPIN
jgi:hypothetical protein